MTKTTTRPVFALLVACCVLLAACGTSGPDLIEVVDAAPSVSARSNAVAMGVPPADADMVWSAPGAPAAVADDIATVEPPDERTDDAEGDVFLLYPSGTVWLTPGTDGTAVVLYNDNDKAYSRHGVILIRNSGWGTRVNNYRSSGSGGSSNGFRGGGSSSGK